MKKMKLNLMLVAVMIGAIGAFAFKPAAPKSTAGDTSYYWFDASGNYTDNYVTKASEVPVSGCSNTGTTLCQGGYLADQCVNDDPNQGIAPGQSPTVQINKN